MAKNTGRGSRAAASQQQPQNMWQRRDTSAGRFLVAKSNGGSFKSAYGRRPGLWERFLDLFM